MERSDDLIDVLTDLGVEVRSVHGDEVSARCPVHARTKGRESTRFSWYMNVDTGLWHCFTCGARGNLSMLISELTPDPGALWKMQSRIIASGLRRLDPDEARYDDDVREDVDWITFAQFRPLPSAICELRRLDPDMAQRYGVRWDPDAKAVVLPIVSPLGELKGWQLKKTGWVRNVPTGVHKGDTLFGIERAFATTVILVESPLDVVRFHSVSSDPDIDCLASFGANVSMEQCKLLSQFDRVVLALDHDLAGHAEMERLRKLEAICPRQGLFFWDYTGSVAKDLGEMDEDEILTGLDRVSRVHRRTPHLPS